MPQKSFEGSEMRHLKPRALHSGAEPELVHPKPGLTTICRKVERAAASRPCRSFVRRTEMLEYVKYKYIVTMA